MNLDRILTFPHRTARGLGVSINPKRSRERHLTASKRLSELLRIMREQHKRAGTFRATRSSNADKAWAMIPAANVEIPRTWLRDWQRRGWVEIEYDGEGGHLCTIQPEFDEKAVCA